jgi:hypothetical protein
MVSELTINSTMLTALRISTLVIASVVLGFRFTGAVIGRFARYKIDRRFCIRCLGVP